MKKDMKHHGTVIKGLVSDISKKHVELQVSQEIA